MFSGLLIILLPLIVGYLIPLHQASALRLINRFLSWIVYVILFFMGISRPFWITATNLLSILHYSAVTVVVILLCNIAALFWLEHYSVEKSSPSGKTAFPNCDGAGIIKTVRRRGARFCPWAHRMAFCSTPPKPANIP